jgi:hypothetical protein
MPTRVLKDHLILTIAAAIAIYLVIARACVQSITIDEADSYLLFAHQSWPAQWYPSSGNHVLNSILMRLITTVFGISELTVRSPAILGAILYIASAFYLAASLATRKLLQLSIFVCLVYNPFVLDYLVAARGYGLAIGCLMAALALIAKMVLSGEATRNECTGVSVFLALSFAANFSFAIANACVLLLFFLWAARREKIRPLAISCFVPGFAVAFVLAGSVVWNWPKGQLYFGSQHLSEMWAGLRDTSFDNLNPEIFNPLLLSWLSYLQPVLPYLAALTFFALLITVEIRRWRSRPRFKDELLTLMRLFTGMAILTIFLHWAALRTFHLLLPKDRTALFLVPFLTLALAAALAICCRSKEKDYFRIAGMGVMLLAAIYFIGCIRLEYFKEWKFDADCKHVYWICEDLQRRCGAATFVTNWRYNSPLNFYRTAYGNHWLPEFTGSADTFPSGKDVYVMFFPDTQEFMKKEGVQVIYHDDRSDVAVAIRGCPAASKSAVYDSSKGSQ